MNFERTAPHALPFLVQVNNKIQAAVQLYRLVLVEVNVRIELLSVEVVVNASAVPLWIQKQVWDPAQVARRGDLPNPGIDRLFPDGSGSRRSPVLDRTLGNSARSRSANAGSKKLSITT